MLCTPVGLPVMECRGCLAAGSSLRSVWLERRLAQPVEGKR